MEMPSEKNNILKFKSQHFKNKVTFVMYADFESINKELDIKTTIDPTETKTVQRKEQMASAVVIYTKSNYPELVKSKIYKSEILIL
jgi:hypothetical protein